MKCFKQKDFVPNGSLFEISVHEHSTTFENR